jgi:hypothetical protein
MVFTVAGSRQPIGMWATDTSFGCNGSEVSQIRTVGRKKRPPSNFTGSSTTAFGSP